MAEIKPATTTFDKKAFDEAELSAEAAAAGLRQLATDEAVTAPGLFVSAESLMRTWSQARRAEPHQDVENAAITRDEVLTRRFAAYNSRPSAETAARLVADIEAFSGRNFEASSIADSVYRIGAKLADMYRLPMAARTGAPGYNPEASAEVRKFMGTMQTSPARASYYPPKPRTGVKIRD
jgi:hypothetical protein